MEFRYFGAYENAGDDRSVQRYGSLSQVDSSRIDELVNCEDCIVKDCIQQGKIEEAKSGTCWHVENTAEKRKRKGARFRDTQTHLFRAQGVLFVQVMTIAIRGLAANLELDGWFACRLSASFI